MNIYAKAPGMDFGQTSGLCGNFNDVASDDAPSSGFTYNSVSSLPVSMQITSDLFAYVAPTTPPPPYSSHCQPSGPIVVGNDVTALLQLAQVRGVKLSSRCKQRVLTLPVLT